MNEIEPAQLGAVIDGADQVRAYAPSLHAVLSTVGPLGEAVEDNAPNIWPESVDLRRSEKATVMRVVAAAAAGLCTVLREFEVGDVGDAGDPALEQAVQAGTEMAERLGEVAEALLSRDRPE